MKFQKSLFAAAVLLLILISGLGFMINGNRLTFREYTRGEPVEADLPAESLQLTADFDIIESFTVRAENAEMLPARAEIYDSEKGFIRELVQTAPEIPGYAAAFRIPFRLRWKNLQGLSVAFKDAEGEEYPIEKVSELYIYGGDRDRFWIGLTVFCVMYLLLLMLRVGYLLNQKKNCFLDRLVCSMLVAAIAFVGMAVLASAHIPAPLDEADNLMGGMLQVHQGRVIYRDYVSQHMPFAYWLSAGLAALGAKSDEQFRLLFQIVLCMIWGAVFFRHFGTKRSRGIALFSFIWGPVSYLLIGENAMQVLSDNIQGIAMSILFLEMMAYFEDHRLSLDRAAVVSACIFASVGSAFISLYPTAICVLMVMAEDIRYHCKRQKLRFFAGRYVQLAAAIMAPFLAGAGYLGIHGALSRAYDMAYRFNTEVYPKYGVELGTNKLTPFYSGIRNISLLVARTFREFQSSGVSYHAKLAHSLETILVFCALGILLRMLVRRQWIEAIGTFMFLQTQGLRQATQFHSIMLWYVLLIFILCNMPGMDCKKTQEEPLHWKKLLPAGAYLLFFWLMAGQVYLPHMKEMLVPRIPLQPEYGYTAVELAGEGQEIFLDSSCLYVLYKGCYPVNRLLWILPWYMDWYKDEVMEDLQKQEPEVAVYHPGSVVWGHTHFSDELDELFEEKYEKTAVKSVYVKKH